MVSVMSVLNERRSGVALALTLTVVVLLGAGGTAQASTASGLSKQVVKRACNAEAEREGLGVGDFGPTQYDGKRDLWTTRLMVRGTGGKFKARCEWDGVRAPRLTVAKTGDDIAAGKYQKRDVTIACKRQAMVQGLGVGDFGDTNWDSRSQQWVSKMMVSNHGQNKRKATCTWNGHDAPVVR